MTSMSTALPNSRRPVRKISRTNRLIRFRATALPTLPLTVIPSLLSPRSLLWLMTTKLCEWTFLPVRDKLRNSGRFLRRADFGKSSLLPFAFTGDYVRARFGGTMTVNCLRPLARRRFSTLRPPGVSIRLKNPCVLFLLTLLG